MRRWSTTSSSARCSRCANGSRTLRLPLETAAAPNARADRTRVLDQLDDYLLPRLRDPGAPVLVVVGGSTGAGKSTLVNSLVGAQVSPSGVLRPTTRWPVLVHHPLDARWFSSDRVLPVADPRGRGGGAGADRRASGAAAGRVRGGAGGPRAAGRARRRLGRGGQPRLAAQLLGAADVWLFVTTAARYADAVPVGAARRTPRAAGRTSRSCSTGSTPAPRRRWATHLRQMLADAGLAAATVSSSRRSSSRTGCCPRRAVGPIADWLTGPATDPAVRAAALAETRDGAVPDVSRRALDLADAADEQRAADARLRAAVAAAYATAADQVAHATSDGSMLRGEVLARWQDVVGTGELFRVARAGGVPAARPGRRLRARAPTGGAGARRGGRRTGLRRSSRTPPRTPPRRAHSAWRHDPAGSALLDGLALSRASADLRGADRRAGPGVAGRRAGPRRDGGRRPADDRAGAVLRGQRARRGAHGRGLRVDRRAHGRRGRHRRRVGAARPAAARGGVRRRGRAAAHAGGARAARRARTDALLDEESSRFTAPARRAGRRGPGRRRPARGGRRAVRSRDGGADRARPRRGAGELPAGGGGHLRGTGAVARGPAEVAEPRASRSAPGGGTLVAVNRVSASAAGTPARDAVAALRRGRRARARTAARRRARARPRAVVARARDRPRCPASTPSSRSRARPARASRRCSTRWRSARSREPGRAPPDHRAPGRGDRPRRRAAGAGARRRRAARLARRPRPARRRQPRRCRSPRPAWCCSTCPTTTRSSPSTARAERLVRARRPAGLGGGPAEVRRRGAARAVPAPARGPRERRRPRAQPGRPAGPREQRGDAGGPAAARGRGRPGRRRRCSRSARRRARASTSCATCWRGPRSGGSRRPSGSPPTCGGGARARRRRAATPPRRAPGGGAAAAWCARGRPRRACDDGRRRRAALAERSARAATGWPLTRWLGRLRPDPLRRLGLGRERVQAGQDDLLRTSLLGAGGGRAVARRSARCARYVDAATAGAPDHWVLAAAVPRGRRDLDDVLDRTVVRVPTATARVPWTWRVLGVLQWVLLAVAVAGLLWLLAARRPRLAPAARARRRRCGGGCPRRRVLLLGGALAGLLVAGLGWRARRASRAAPGRAARRRARRVGGAGGERPRHRAGGREMDALARCRAAASRPRPDRSEDRAHDPPRGPGPAALVGHGRLRARQQRRDAPAARGGADRGVLEPPVAPDGPGRGRVADGGARRRPGARAVHARRAAGDRVPQAARLPPHAGDRRDVDRAPRRREPGRLLRGARRGRGRPRARHLRAGAHDARPRRHRDGAAAAHRRRSSARRGRTFLEEPVTIRRRR